MARGKPIGSFYVQLGLNTQEFRKNLQGAQRDLRQAFGSSSIRASEALAASIAGIGVAMAGVGAVAVKLSADLETQTKAFERLLGGAEAARKELEYLQDFAAKTPFTFTELVAYEKRMLALGFSVSEVRELLTTLGDTASGLDLPAEGMGRLIKAFGDIRSKGALATQELNQLSEAGVGARQILADSLGKTVPELMAMVEDRAIDSATAITIITEGLNKKFGGMMEIQANTMTGMWSTVRDETENILRDLGSKITKYFKLDEALRSLRDGLSSIRTEIQERGILEALSGLFGPKMKIAITALAGAITGALIPAIISFGGAIAVAIAPIAPLILSLGLILGGIQAAYQAWKVFGADIKTTLAGIPELGKAAFNLVKAAVEGLAGLIFKIIGKISEAIFQKLSESNNRIKKAIAPVFESIADVFKVSGDFWRDSSRQSLEAAARFGDAMNKIKEVYQAEKDIADFEEWTGIENFYQLWQKIEKVVGKTKSSILEQLDPIKSFVKNITGLGGRPDTASTTPGKPAKENPLIEEARRTSEAIERQWVDATKTQQEQLGYQFEQELAILNKSKEVNKNYYRDLQRLSDVYSAKGRALMEADFIAREEYLTGQQQAELEALAARDNAFYESFINRQNGWELEQQLMQDMQAGDLEAYIAHLNEKSAADRAYLEGRKELIQVYDQLQRDANRTTASYMAENYKAVYSGLTDALVNFDGGLRGVGERLKQLGSQLIQMVVKQMVQQKLAHALSESLKAAATASSLAHAALIAAAWAPAAAMVNAATFGQAVISSVSSFKALGGALSGITGGLPMWENGAYITGPTLGWVGEGKENEWILPDSKLSAMLASASNNSGGGVQVNITNNSGVPISGNARQRMDGKRVVVDLLIDAIDSNTGGIRAILGGGR